MKEKFKYGPLVFNYPDAEDDTGNYWWPGLPPVGYDDARIPIDKLGLQCLPLQSPVHPQYTPVDSQHNRELDIYLPSIEEWKSWFDSEFIDISDHRIKREILKWLVKDYTRLSEKFTKAQAKCNTLDELVEIVWQPDENK
tara:strand:- start:1125 stop:1544 length:420 start_codon:yes stop_codon:yes gene_type:complete